MCAAVSQTLKDAINEAMRDWVTNVRDTHYLVGTAIGPHPFPTIVRDFQSVIGKTSREGLLIFLSSRISQPIQTRSEWLM